MQEDGGDQQRSSAAPVSSWSRTLWVMVASQVITQLAFTLALPFLPLYIAGLGVHNAREAALWAGVSSTASGLAMAAFAPLWGRLADRLGRKAMVLRATFSGVFVVGAMGLVGSPMPLLLLRLLQGALTGTVSAANTLVAVTVPPNRLGFSLGLMQTAVLAGAAGGPLIGGLLADQLGYRFAFGVTAALLVVAGALVLFGAHEGQRPAPRPRGERLRPNVKALAPVIVVSFLDQFAGSVASPVLPLFIVSLAGSGSGASTATGFVLGSVALSASLGSLLAGRMVDRPVWVPWLRLRRGHTLPGGTVRLGRVRLRRPRGTLLGVSSRDLLTVCAVGACLFTLLQGLAPDVGWLGLNRVLMGLFIGGTIPAANVVLGAVTSPETRGAAFGYTASASSLGFALGPLVGALLLSFGYRLPFFVTAVLMAVQAVWVFYRVPARLAAQPE